MKSEKEQEGAFYLGLVLETPTPLTVHSILLNDSWLNPRQNMILGDICTIY